MITCGLKLTHDGGVAVFDGSRLLFSVEVEKLSNNPRHAEGDRLDVVEEILAAEGMDPADVDVFVVDGWHAAGAEPVARLSVRNRDRAVALSVAPYHETPTRDGALTPYHGDGLPLGGRDRSYVSYHHATGHVFAAYSTSPFAARGEPAHVLSWDGGMLPLLYEVRPEPFAVRSLGPLLPLYGNAFTEFAGHFAPYRAEFTAEQVAFGRTRPSGVAGKAMAYAGLGRADAVAELGTLLDEADVISIETGAALGRDVQRQRDLLFPGRTDADLIASFQEYLGRQLVGAFRRVLGGRATAGKVNLCLSGGCALNIKWNSALRSSGLFAEVWVPPFPNDAGSALGTACAHLAGARGEVSVAWDPYQGPHLVPPELPPGWQRERCDPAGVARLLHEQGQPVVVLDGRAELGPRALGNRSILAPADDPKMKDRLNEMKGRESYRPVAPICLEAFAPQVFDPGTPDPYMLFDHAVRDEWRDRIPAAVHLDGTARLQTVNPGQHPVLAEILASYAERTGVPVLCNTSANHQGRGFFPDASSAMRWGAAEYVWSQSWLYTAPGAAKLTGAPKLDGGTAS
ncbi:carbamoyltransferase N-terminal domain-containing protein [Plantactinospora sp. WMMB334]|uniref:carbamoyltransferase N-terminal domain-containing protein n=1 Tax=Plantactinospora sp. WMMB334 TaxID=3404119 RepID=UPI003B959B75